MKNLKKFWALISITAKLCPSIIVLFIANSIITSATALFNVLFPKLLIDCLMSNRDVKTISIYAGLVVANNIILLLFKNFFNKKNEDKTEFLVQRMKCYLGEKVMKLEYSYLEDPYYLDLKDRALFAIQNQSAIAVFINFISKIITQTATIITLLVILFSLSPWLILMLFIGCVLELLFVGKMSSSMKWLQTELIPINRRFGYYWDVCANKKYQKDIRLYGMQSLLTNKVKTFVNEISKQTSKSFGKIGSSLGAMNVVTWGIIACAYIYIGIRTASDVLGPQISIGSLTMYVNSMATLCQMTVEYGANISQLQLELSYLDPYMEFMALKDQSEDFGKEKFNGPIETIEFKNVSFTYPKAEKEILHDVSFTINRGEKISIVGLNGAGKSTMVKLICRMYKPTSGAILINGKNIDDWDYNSFMKTVSAVFQDYSIFNMSIAENISCSESNIDREKVSTLLSEVGLTEKVNSLPNKMDSRFGKEYDEDGIEMSGGQAQKIAIARALYKEASMVILDEPASALDPIAEAEIYEKFNSLVSDKTAIYISHRMSSSVFCDKILIIDGGSVSDFDSHKNLMQKKESLYYKLFMSQADNYRIEKEEPVLA